MQKTAFLSRLVTSVCLIGWLGVAHAEVKLSDAWVRASNPGQSVGAAYVTLSSAQDVTLVYAETERAGTVEMHSMTMQNGVMKMRSMEELPVPAGKPVKLAPGGLHLMLFELPTPLKAGEQVKFRLCFKDKQGKITDQFVTMPVKAAP
ncbi:copper chaperone PCu(A)C [Methylophilus sp. QUAN]|uniref:copper chaperone PCu(A)C n=1 Tax=Methylophilus sp. QUAN TaxID=2781020 RepID=UPI00188EBF4B|nr:copper chaperone PCu(A)C [Methylophilus sp. QUAN]MBF4990369.1 copper chaperone PCu(A)C [Methylophilus sp. QUAN]